MVNAFKGYLEYIQKELDRLDRNMKVVMEKGVDKISEGGYHREHEMVGAMCSLEGYLERTNEHLEDFIKKYLGDKK